MARLFVRAARAVSEGAPAYDTGGQEHHVRRGRGSDRGGRARARISFEDTSFGEAADFDGSALESALGPIEWRSLERWRAARRSSDSESSIMARVSFRSAADQFLERRLVADWIEVGVVLRHVAAALPRVDRLA